MFYVVIYAFCTAMVGNISTPAGGLVKSKWAGVRSDASCARNECMGMQVKNMQQVMFSVVGSMLFSAGLVFVKKFCLNKSWRFMLITTTVAPTQKLCYM